MKRICLEFSSPHRKLSWPRNFTRGLHPCEYQTCFPTWHVTRNIWNQIFFRVLFHAWQFKNLTFKCIFLTYFSPTTYLVALPFVYFWQNSVRSTCQNNVFWRPGFLPFQGEESLGQNGTTASTWQHPIKHINRGQRYFSLKSGPHQDHRARAYRAVYICTSVTWKPAPDRQGDWPFPLLLLLDTSLISPDISWKWIILSVLEMFVLKSHLLI